MEAVARQLATEQNVVIIRNGWFSYRWTQILEKGNIAQTMTVLTAQTDLTQPNQPFTPVAIETAIATIQEQKPAIVFAPHVETASGMMLPDDYIRQLAEAVHSVGGLLVIDCIASGCIWLDMQDLGIDVLISAPQKGWSSTPCAGLVMLSKKAIERVEATESTSFSCDLKQWLTIMRTFENGGHAYHTTMPTDSLAQFRDTVKTAESMGLDQLKSAQIELGKKVRALLTEKGFVSVAGEGYQAPSVVVSYTNRDDIQKGTAFVAQGLQIAAGVPLQVGEPAGFKTFRLGLFGLDKLQDIEGTVSRLRTALDNIV